MNQSAEEAHGLNLTGALEQHSFFSRIGHGQAAWSGADHCPFSHCVRHFSPDSLLQCSLSHICSSGESRILKQTCSNLLAL